MKLFIGLLIVLAIFCLVSIWHASTTFHKVFYRLSSDKTSKPVKFVFLTDLHDKQYGKDNYKLLKAIEQEQPDAVLIAGDMLTAGPDRTCQVAEQFVTALCKRYPVYYGLGNHEAKMSWAPKSYKGGYQKYVDRLAGAGVKFLRNGYLTLPDMPIRIYGLDMEKKYYKRSKRTPMEDAYLYSKLGRRNDAYYNIVLAHNPTYFDVYANWKPELVLSGHIHGGLVRLPFLGGVIAPSLRLFPKYDGGRFTEQDSTMLLSRGLGFHSVEFRMWNPAELVVITISPTKD